MKGTGGENLLTYNSFSTCFIVGFFVAASNDILLSGIDLSETKLYFESIDFTGSPIVLGTHNFIARSRAHTGWSFGVTFGGIHDVTYSSEAYWSYTLGKNNLYNHEIVCGIDEVDRPKLRITVSRDGKSMAMIGLQSTSLGAPDSTRLYIRNIERDTLVETSAADGWVSIDNIALMNI